MKRAMALAVACLVSSAVVAVQPEPTEHPDYQAVKQVLLDSIGWAMNKDVDRLFQIFANDDDLQLWWVSSSGGARGIEDLKRTAETVWMTPDFKATRFEFRDVRIRFSKDGAVAWFSCTFDDCGIWKGDEYCMESIRKTGVMEKRDGQWTIVQSHASWPIDAIPEDVWQKLVERRASAGEGPS